MIKLLNNENHFLIIFQSFIIVQVVFISIQTKYVNSKSISSIRPAGGQFYINDSSSSDNIVVENYSDDKSKELELDMIRFNSKKLFKLTTSKNQKSSNNDNNKNDSSSIHASSVTSHYQVINICNTLPSILKCQNKHHFIIMHRVIHGISDSRDKNECSFKTSCYQVDENDYYNCTGSNMCVFNPIDRYLHTCEQVKSNLTQVHITCVNLSHLKKFYLQKNKKIESNFESSFSNMTDRYTTNSVAKEKKGMILNVINTNASLLNASSKTDLRMSSSIVWDTWNLSHNSLILISITIFSSLVVTILISLIYYRIKIKQLMNVTSKQITNKNSKDKIITLSKSSSAIDSSIVINNSINSNSYSSISQIPPPPPGFENSFYGQSDFLTLPQPDSNKSHTTSKNSINKNQEVKFKNLRTEFDNMQNNINKKLSVIRKMLFNLIFKNMNERKKITNHQQSNNQQQQQQQQKQQNSQTTPKIVLREKQQGQTTSAVQEKTSIMIDYNSRRLESSTDFDYNTRNTEDNENDKFYFTQENQKNNGLQFKNNYFNNDLYGSNITNNKINASNNNFAFTSKWLSKRSGIVVDMNDEKLKSNIESYNFVSNIKYLNSNAKTNKEKQSLSTNKNNIVYSTLKTNSSSSQSDSSDSSPSSSTPESSPLTSPSSSPSDTQSDSSNLISSSNVNNNQPPDNNVLYSFYHPFVGINFNHILYDIPEEEADLDNFEYDPKKNSNFC